MKKKIFIGRKDDDQKIKSLRIMLPVLMLKFMMEKLNGCIFLLKMMGY